MDISKRNNITASLQQNPVDWQKILLDSIACFGCSTGTLHFLNAEKAGDSDNNMLQLKAQVGIPEFLIPRVTQIPIGKGMAGIAAERRKPVEMCNLQTDTSGVARPAAKETKVEGSIAVPLMHNDVLYGTLGIAKPIPYEFTRAERDGLMDIGEEIAMTLV